MSEERQVDIILLDDQHIEIRVKSRLYAYELLSMVASRWNLKEKNYFGLSYRDETGHYQWLQNEKHVLDHDFPKKSGTITLYFQVKFYIENILLLLDRSTVALFYLQSKQFLCKGLIETESETIFELSAYILQITHGNFTDESESRNNMKNFLLPRKILEENPSIAYCEDQIISYYKRLSGHSNGSAIIKTDFKGLLAFIEKYNYYYYNAMMQVLSSHMHHIQHSDSALTAKCFVSTDYMSIVESLPTYGVHYYSVKDKSGLPWWLGVGVRGLAVFDYADKKTPRKLFPWRTLENLFFRDKKFTIEVNEPKNRMSSSSHKMSLLSSSTTTESNTVTVVYTWLAPSTNLARSIWTMAVHQHQFYLDRKHFKSRTSLPWNIDQLKLELDFYFSKSSSINNTKEEEEDTMNTSFSTPNLSSSILLHSNSLKKSESSLRDEDVNEALKKDRIIELKCHKLELEKHLDKKLEDLKELCLKEAELTGSMPDDLKLYFGSEVFPPIKKRIGTSFTLSPRLLNNHLNPADELGQLEVEYEIQEKLMTAALRLAHDRSTSKTIRKKHRQAYEQEKSKLKELESKIIEFKQRTGEALLLMSSKSNEDLDDDYDDNDNDANVVLECSQSVKITQRPTFYPSFSHSNNKDPDKNSNYSSTSNQSSSSTSLTEQQQSPTSGIKIYPKKKLAEVCYNPSVDQSRPTFFHNRSIKNNSTLSSENNWTSSSSPSTTKKHNRFSSSSTRSSIRVEGRRRSGHVSRGPSSRSDENNSSTYNTNTHTIVPYSCYNNRDLPADDGRKNWHSNKHSSLDRRRKSSGVVSDRNKIIHPEVVRRGSIELPQLIPSKYGSKRDSTIDRDTPTPSFDEDACSDTTEESSTTTLPQSHHDINSFARYPFVHQRATPCSYPAMVQRESSDSSGYFQSSKLDRKDSLTSGFSMNSQNSFSPTQLVLNSNPTEEFNYSFNSPGLSERAYTTSSHFYPPPPQQLHRCSERPSGPQDLVRIVVPRSAAGFRGHQFDRNERNQDAVDALFKHHEQKSFNDKSGEEEDASQLSSVINSLSLKKTHSKGHLTVECSETHFSIDDDDSFEDNDTPVIVQNYQEEDFNFSQCEKYGINVCSTLV